ILRRAGQGVEGKRPKVDASPTSHGVAAGPSLPRKRGRVVENAWSAPSPACGGGLGLGLYAVTSMPPQDRGEARAGGACQFFADWGSGGASTHFGGRAMNEDAKKTALRMIPYGIYVLTADDGSGNVAAATVNWVTQTAFSPPLVVVGVKT